MRSLDVIPGLRDELAAGRREERFRGAADLPNYYRTSFGDGWALVGDAGHHKDPTTGFGMSDAFASAELLATAADAALVGERPWEQALCEYQRRRDDATANGFRLTLSAASLDPLPAHLQRLYEAASTRPEAVTRLIGVLAAQPRSATGSQEGSLQNWRGANWRRTPTVRDRDTRYGPGRCCVSQGRLPEDRDNDDRQQAE